MAQSIRDSDKPRPPRDPFRPAVPGEMMDLPRN